MPIRQYPAIRISCPIANSRPAPAIPARKPWIKPARPAAALPRVIGGPARYLFPPLAFGMPLGDAIPLPRGSDRVSQILGVVGLIVSSAHGPQAIFRMVRGMA